MTSEINDIPFIELINNKASIHKKSIQMLLIAVYKNLNGLSQPIILGKFTTRTTYIVYGVFGSFILKK